MQNTEHTSGPATFVLSGESHAPLENWTFPLGMSTCPILDLGLSDPGGSPIADPDVVEGITWYPSEIPDQSWAASAPARSLEGARRSNLERSNHPMKRSPAGLTA